MELPAGVNRRYASFSIVVFVAIWLWVAFDRPYVFPDHVPWNIYSAAPQSSAIFDVFDSPPLSSPTIKKLCAGTQFNTSVVFTCDHNKGNVAEVRNSILHCVRYAIAAGASLVLPKIVGVERELGKTENTFDMEYMFDTKHFIKSLELSCPQMYIHKFLAERPNQEDGRTTITLDPATIATKDKNGKMTVANTAEWRGSFYTWLSQYLVLEDESAAVVHLTRSYLEWPLEADDASFVAHFGKILKLREDIRTLATIALIKMSATFSLNIPAKVSIARQAFLGAYLTIQDGSPAIDEERKQARFNTQLKLYLGQAAASNLSLIYLASDENSYIPTFVAKANNATVKVTTKFELLKGRDREDLLALDPQQQAMVDFLMLSKASDFAGVGYSSLAWNIGLKRHQYSEQEEDWLNGEQAILSDELSQIYGPQGAYAEFVRSMWP